MNNHRFNPGDAPEWLARVFSEQIENQKTGLLVGINEDDCAVLDLGGELLVITSDILNSWPICLEYGLGSQSTLGHLVVTASLSDL
ncbi:MAG TPA: hypothetical protein ENH10_02630, partial [Bacteroidetes bacterium]|nr:hypothetical protein [Bacteroidota bacterium]HEX04036.1 hypothetical protein [Bacteroidota bacterium]